METAPSSYTTGSPEEAAAQSKDRMVSRALFGNGVFTAGDVKTLPKHQQHQGALEHQLDLLRLAANQLGLYDAADYLARRR